MYVTKVGNLKIENVRYNVQYLTSLSQDRQLKFKNVRYNVCNKSG